MFAGLTERYIRPTILYHLQIYSAGRQIGQITATIHGQIVLILVAKVVEHFFIITAHPTGCIGGRILPNALSPVLIAQSERHQIELQNTYSADNKFVLRQWLKDLGRALFRQLLDALLRVVSNAADL